MPDGDALQGALEDLTGQHTVPNTFINKKHIGGNDDLQDLLYGGKLQKILKDAGALKA
jgi:glutaredoxin 3